MHRVPRRDVLALAAAAACGRAPAAAAPRGDDGEPVAFFVIGDTHYLADAADPSRLDPASAAMTDGLIDALNGLTGSGIPPQAGGGTVRRPCGVIHAGDIIDTGDKQGEAAVRMQRTEIAAFERAMGLDGRDGRLAFPLYEVHGNHDGPQAVGVAIDRIVARNGRRPGIARVSADGLHYSWDAGGVHVVHLGIVVGEVPGIVLFLQPLIPWGSTDDEGPMDIGRLDASVYPAVQNFCVAARALGLGTALTTVIRIRGAEALEAIGAPAGRYEVAALTPLGHPTGRFGVAPRKPAAAVTHWDTWGAKRR